MTEHLKSSHKLSKTIRQAEKVDSNNYSDTKKKGKFFKRRENVKITKRKYPFEVFARSFNVEILNSFNYKLKILNLEFKVS